MGQRSTTHAELGPEEAVAPGGASSIFTSFLLDGDYLGPHGTPLAADQVEQHDGPLVGDMQLWPVARLHRD